MKSQNWIGSEPLIKKVSVLHCTKTIEMKMMWYLLNLETFMESSIGYIVKYYMKFLWVCFLSW